jgi:hypothetical protein
MNIFHDYSFFKKQQQHQEEQQYTERPYFSIRNSHYDLIHKTRNNNKNMIFNDHNQNKMNRFV